MDQLREVLREVLREELAPVTGRLDSLEGRFDGLESRFDGLEGRFGGLEGRFDGLESQVSLIREQLDRIEHAQTEDVVAMLHMIDRKITTRTDQHEYQIDALNHRLLIVEADVRKLMQTSIG